MSVNIATGSVMQVRKVSRGRIQPNNVEETSSISVYRTVCDALPWDDNTLIAWTRETSLPVIDHVPGFRYWDMDDRRRMSRPDNVCGHQQRAFDFYWQIKAATEFGNICLGLGTTNSIGPFTLGTDKFCGVSPDPERYGENYGYPHMQLNADSPTPFFDGSFSAVLANHVIEHLVSAEITLTEMLRVTRVNGFVCLITPDMAFSDRGSIDPTHTHEWGADEFYNALQQWTLPPCELVEFNTLDNDFSFNVVLRRV